MNLLTFFLIVLAAMAGTGLAAIATWILLTRDLRTLRLELARDVADAARGAGRQDDVDSTWWTDFASTLAVRSAARTSAPAGLKVAVEGLTMPQGARNDPSPPPRGCKLCARLRRFLRASKSLSRATPI